MSAGKLGGPQTMEYRGPNEMMRPGFGIQTDDLKFPQFESSPAVLPEWQLRNETPPGYQQPQPQQPNQYQQQQQQYFQQMHKNMDGMNQALQQIEQMKMPGGQHPGGRFNPGFGNKNPGKGISF